MAARPWCSALNGCLPTIPALVWRGTWTRVMKKQPASPAAITSGFRWTKTKEIHNVNGIIDDLADGGINQPITVITLGEALNIGGLMLPDSDTQVIRHSNIERATGAGHDVNPIFVVFRHSR